MKVVKHTKPRDNYERHLLNIGESGNSYVWNMRNGFSVTMSNADAKWVSDNNPGEFTVEDVDEHDDATKSKRTSPTRDEKADSSSSVENTDKG